ncbi:MAG: hypothetical protein WCV86_00870 [Patescibacteria group bacterium]|jgi:hypothetical protein
MILRGKSKETKARDYLATLAEMMALAREFMPEASEDAIRTVALKLSDVASRLDEEKFRLTQQRMGVQLIGQLAPLAIALAAILKS